jgi:hypothetical protein
VVVVALVGAVAIVATRSHHAAPTAGARQVVLGGRFRSVRAGVYGVIASGDFAVSTNGLGLAQGAVVVNDRTGATTPLYRGCFVEGIGDPWLLLGCPQVGGAPGGYALQLYSLPNAARQPVADNPNLPYSPCNDEFLRCAFPDGVGAQWIRFDARCSQCQDAYFFENIQTTQVRADPTSATTFTDLGSPDLARSTCSGVRVLPRTVGGRSGWGSLMLYGRVALATGSDADGRQAAYLERCGTPGRRLLATGPPAGTPPPVASNAQAIVWQAARSRLSGFFLPGLEPFTIPLSSAIVAAEGPDARVAAVALTSRAVYVLDRLGGRLWRLPVATGRAGSRIHSLHEPG